ncbi:MAG: glutaredoxin [Spirochaetes bacterium]|nr:MAG: glutaredoxin [Spirochaetota bacterium]
MVTIYTFPECPYCTALKEIYTKEGIEYRDVNITLPENEEEWNQIAEVSKAEEVPVIKIGLQLLVPNVSFQSIEEAGHLTKKFLA